MWRVLAEIAVKVEGRMALAFRCAEAFDVAVADPAQAAYPRLLAPIAKYWVTKRCPVVIAETMEALGGAGYIEGSVMPRLFRASPLNGIWEGSGNVIALDVLRALSRDPDAATRLMEELGPTRSLSLLAGEASDALAAELRPDPPDERRAP